MTPGQGVDAIAAYETEMIPYGFACVADSLALHGSSGDDLLHKRVLGRLALAGNRTRFWLTDRIPALKWKFLDDLYTYRSDGED